MDFRGYLQQTAPQYLKFTGNDARIDPTKPGYDTPYGSYLNTPGNLKTVQNEVSQLYNNYLNRQGPNLGYNAGANSLGSLGGSNAPAIPNFNINSIYNQAGSQAAAQVNPYYTQQLQQFQANQAQSKALQEQQRQLNLENLQNQLSTNLQNSALSRTRTSQDVLQNEQQIGQQADYRQQDQGQQFDEARLAQAKQLAASGLTGSGLGNQQVLKSQTQRNVQEQRQAAGDQQAIAAQELSKARTFEDLSRSDVLAQQAKKQGEKQQQIDWDKFVQGQAQDLQQTQQQLEQQRLGRLSEVQRQLAQQQLNNLIHNLSNPYQRAAAASAYGGVF